MSDARKLPCKKVLFCHDTFTSNKENTCQMYVSFLLFFFFSFDTQHDMCNAVIAIDVLFEQTTVLSARLFL